MKSKMSIEGKLPQGYVILCSGNGGEYSFLQRNLGLSVECPHCGTTAESTTLAMEFYLATNGDAKSAAAATVHSIHSLQSAQWRTEDDPRR